MSYVLWYYEDGHLKRSTEFASQGEMLSFAARMVAEESGSPYEAENVDTGERAPLFLTTLADLGKGKGGVACPEHRLPRDDKR